MLRNDFIYFKVKRFSNNAILIENVLFSGLRYVSVYHWHNLVYYSLCGHQSIHICDAEILEEGW